MNHCKKLHQNDYKSDDELDFIPILITSSANVPSEKQGIGKSWKAKKATKRNRTTVETIVLIENVAGKIE